MCDLLGPDLDAAVARALRIEGLVSRPNGQPAWEFEWEPEGLAHERDMNAWKMWRHYSPSTNSHLAMALLIQFGMHLRPALHTTNPPWRATIGLSGGFGQGATPEIAICRAVLMRAELVRECAWSRAEQARRNRTPWTDFANDEERAAYALAMDQQLRIVQSLNPGVYGGQA